MQLSLIFIISEWQAFSVFMPLHLSYNSCIIMTALFVDQSNLFIFAYISCVVSGNLQKWRQICNLWGLHHYPIDKQLPPVIDKFMFWGCWRNINKWCISKWGQPASSYPQPHSIRHFEKLLQFVVWIVMKFYYGLGINTP